MSLWREKRKTKPARTVADILRERNERRTAALIACITEISGAGGPETVTHSLVAERAGLPLQWVEWQYPSQEKLLAVAGR
ncbi:DNA-binding transcriptional regulator YbjK [Arthrobacter globiformis]|jgi:DNA-binding transcriptional regulator YbjK|nr:DNA-binding transcriptional regulator YbjK [Arthrobacter globiformis]